MVVTIDPTDYDQFTIQSENLKDFTGYTEVQLWIDGVKTVIEVGDVTLATGTYVHPANTEEYSDGVYSFALIIYTSGNTIKETYCFFKDNNTVCDILNYRDENYTLAIDYFLIKNSFNCDCEDVKTVYNFLKDRIDAIKLCNS